MLKSRRYPKFIAVFFSILLLTNLILPNTVYALTSGPTSPEATSFEPVDTTDMVNLLSGDLVYNVPLLEVPGPEGGYPLSLSYHAGIQPNEDASWVGLGWNLSAGAINRNVNGYPDDFQQVQYSRRDYWGGGERRTYGVNIGFANSHGASFGLSVSQDTYQGLSLTSSAGVGAFGFTGGEDGMGFTYSMRTQIPLDGISSLGVNISTNFKSVSYGVGLVRDNTNMIGIDMTTGKGGASIGFSAGRGSFSTQNSNAGKISSKGFAFGIPIPGTGVSLSYSYTRYWSDETQNSKTNGSLKLGGYQVLVSQVIYPNSTPHFFPRDVEAFDYNNLYDETPYSTFYPDPRFQQGGTYPSFDNYTITGQGVSGNFRPYQFQGQVLQGGIKSNETTHYINVDYLPFYSNTNAQVNPEFRFINDFSNSYRQSLTTNYTNLTSDIFNQATPFDASPVYGDNDGTFGFNTTKQELAGSRNIEYYTNTSISNGTAKTNGFIAPSGTLGFTRLSTTEGGPQIGGFSVTNESGVTYHFGLPVYSKDERVHTEKVDQSVQNGGQGGNELKRDIPYAHTWYLTSITGPDFVDVNLDGLADQNDYGYYVNFEYGKWTDGYIWRNPSEGYARDLDNDFKTFSQGRKEIYYLNAIKTRTHTALYVKEIRQDGLGEGESIYNTTTIGPISNLLYSEGTFDATSKKVMQLSKVILLNTADIPNQIAISNSYSGHLGANMIDMYDYTTNQTALTNAAIRIVDFTYDYSLSQGTSNAGGGGKLTLKEVSFKGRNGVCKIPPLKFYYDYQSGEGVSGTINIQNISSMNPLLNNVVGSLSTTANFAVGDILDLNPNMNAQLVLIDYNSTTSLFKFKWLNGTIPNTTFSSGAKTTKNPYYKAQYFDMWGMYKSDFNLDNFDKNPNLARSVSVASSKSVDVWSLRKIKTSLGADINIEYESDDYGKSIWTESMSFIMKHTGPYITLSGGQQSPTVSFYIENGGYTETELFAGNPKARIELSVNDIHYDWPDGRHEIAVSDPFILQTSNIASDGKITVNVNFPGFAPHHTGDFVLEGNLVIDDLPQRFGGGTRVKSLGMTNADGGFTSKTTYNYKNVDSESITSGVTSYEPNVFSSCDYTNIVNVASWSNNEKITAKKGWKGRTALNVGDLLKLSSELPPPAVLYEFVTTESKIQNGTNPEKNIEGKSVYQFIVPKTNMMGRKVLNSVDHTIAFLDEQHTKSITIKNFFSLIGGLKRVVHFDNAGKRLSETTNHYLHDGLETLTFDDFASQYESRLAQFKYQGVVKERNLELKWNRNGDAGHHRYATMSAREEFPVIQTGTTNIDYKSGIKGKTDIIGFDFYSGSVTQKVETDGYGNRVMTEVIPAYRKYPAMGLKVNTNSNKHMLSQEAASYAYKVDANNTKLGLIGANIQTWSTGIIVERPDYSTITHSIWRKALNYVWNPSGTTTDGITAMGFSDFNWTTPASSDPGWNKMGEITRYNVYSAALEGKDINGIFSTTKMGYNNSRVILTSEGAAFKEVAYSGAEDEGSGGLFGGNISKGAGGVFHSSTIPFNNAHTGHSTLRLHQNQTGFLYSPGGTLDNTKDYYMSVWVKSSGGGAPNGAKLFYQESFGTPVESVTTPVQAGTSGWYLLTMKISGSALIGLVGLTFGCRNTEVASMYFDDFRLQPVNSNLTTFVYDKLTGQLIYTLDNNNLYTRFEYDAAGRLIKTYKETMSKGGYLVNETEYNMSQSCN